MTTKVNLGSGRDIRKGWTNIDIKDWPGIDVIYDISKGIPLGSNSVDEIYASHILEHIHDYQNVIYEIFRVLKPGGTIMIRVPYGMEGFNSPFHYRYFLPETLDMFCLEDLKISCLEDMNRIRALDTLIAFNKLDVHVNRRCKYRYHLKKYFGLRFPAYGINHLADGPDLHWLDRWFGVKYEIIYKLMKPLEDNVVNVIWLEGKMQEQHKGEELNQ